MCTRDSMYQGACVCLTSQCECGKERHRQKGRKKKKWKFFLSISITRMINLDGVTCQWNKSLQTRCLHFVNVSETWRLQKPWSQIITTTIILHSGNHHMDYPTQKYLIMRLMTLYLSIWNESIATSFCIFEIKHCIIWNHMFIFITDIVFCPLQEPESSYIRFSPIKIYIYIDISFPRNRHKQYEHTIFISDTAQRKYKIGWRWSERPIELIELSTG